MNTQQILEAIESHHLISYERAHYHVVSNATCFLFDLESDSYNTDADSRAHDDLMEFLSNKDVFITFHETEYIFAKPFWKWLNRYSEECEAIAESREENQLAEQLLKN